MKNINIFWTLFIFLNVNCFSQDLKFSKPSPLYAKELSVDFIVPVKITLPKSKVETKVSLKVDDQKSSAEKGKDYDISLDTLKLNLANEYSTSFNIVIKSDNFSENQEEVHIVFSYQGDSSNHFQQTFILYIADLEIDPNDELQYTEEEKRTMKSLTMNIFTGGNLDFVDKLKFNNIFGEVSIYANDVAWNRYGIMVGISNFQNVTKDSINTQTELTLHRLDTTKAGRYLIKTFRQTDRVASNQWSYNFSITRRINNTKGSLFNIYLSVRSEIVKYTSAVFHDEKLLTIDTLYSNNLDNGYFGPYTDVVDYSDSRFIGNFTLGTPIFINAKDKFNLYVDPNVGYSVDRKEYVNYTDKNNVSSIKVHRLGGLLYLFRLRVTEQHTGLGITLGGEIRGTIYNLPAVNAYAGIRVDIAKWFGNNN